VFRFSCSILIHYINISVEKMRMSILHYIIKYVFLKEYKQMFEKCNFSLEYAANYTVLYSDAPILMLISVA
jgi:hypothetical protein